MSRETLIVNHDTYMHEASDISSYPHWVAEAMRQELSIFDHILWVKNQVSGIWHPWLCSVEHGVVIKKLESGIDSISEHDLWYAKSIGVVLDAEKLQDERLVFSMALAQCRSQMKHYGYCLVPNVLIPSYENTIRFYINSVQGHLVTDHQVKKRVGRGNLALFSAMHVQLTSVIQSVVPEAIKPSYCYGVVYDKDAVLERHTDRPQCVYNASITFHRGEGPAWPIHLEINGEDTPITAEVGEVVVYSGTTIPHWREAQEAQSSVVCFFHFVRQGWLGSLD